jgi:hypothetical protein
MGTLRIEIPKEEIEAFCRKRWISSRREVSAIRSVVRRFFAPPRWFMQPDLRDAGYLFDMIALARGVLRTVQGRSITEYLANEEIIEPMRTNAQRALSALRAFFGGADVNCIFEDEGSGREAALKATRAEVGDAGFLTEG